MTWQWIVVGWAVLGALPGLLLLYGTVLIHRRCRQLGDVAIPDRASWPSLSVVIPACNEADTLEPALRSLLAQRYPRLQIVLIDDRSTDGTGALVDRLAREDSRITALHVRELPPGWLGKVNALQRGVEAATGELILFTDADVHYAPDLLERAVELTERERYDHLAVFPVITQRSFIVGVCIGAAVRSIFALLRPWEAMDPRSDKAVGAGAFNLVRRSAFDRTPGFEWLRLEVADDIGLALMMKRSGGKPGLALGRDQVSVEWYPTLGQAIRGLEKNGFAQAARFTLWRALVMVTAVLVFSVGALAWLIPVGVPHLWLAGAVGLGSFACAGVMIGRMTATPLPYVLLSLPLGDLIMAYIVLRGTILGLRRGGLVWRGTTYPTAELLAGRRVDM